MVKEYLQVYVAFKVVFASILRKFQAIFDMVDSSLLFAVDKPSWVSFFSFSGYDHLSKFIWHNHDKYRNDYTFI